MLFHANNYLGSMCWTPAADVYRTKRGWLIKIELAGVKLEDIKVTVQGCSLIIQGRRLDRVIQQGFHPYTLEITYSEFEREIELPTTVDESQLQFELVEGMFMIHACCLQEERE